MLGPNGEIITLSPDAKFNRGSVSYSKGSGVALGENITEVDV